MQEVLKTVYQGILHGNLEGVQESVGEAVQAGLDADNILKGGLIPAMTEVGRLFEEGEYFVPEMLVAARAMQGGLEILKPLLVEEDVKPVGKVVIGTVKGDLHDIGKNLVAMMLEGAGFEVIDLGTDVSPDKFAEQAREKGADIVAMSALLTTTMTNMMVTIKAIEEAGLREKVKIMVGGAPLTDEYAIQIGADGYAADASQAAKLALSF
ncbi:MAG TPA: cobalamin-binding protein [Anaerolineae bacterium]|nr:cobalamin-binding protein [Anaerolineae bacterium]